MQGPIGGDRIWVDSDMEKIKVAAQDKANAQEKGADEGGICYGYQYTMNNSNYAWREDDLAFSTIEELGQITSNGIVGKAYIVYKEA
ncbi:MAG: hypothetical protein RSB04_11925 [Gordonibacter sp.]|uniref:hypothetical protein n=1 Tax=Gordonibacter sp. TaxID=1968902 RepID=UPI002FC62BE9